MPAETAEAPPSGLPKILKQCGPGVITGAANDDPSCIVSYSMAGASFGYLTLWTSLYFLPLIATVQLLCSRLGMVGGRGLAGSVRAHYSRWVLYPLCACLAIANVVTLGADLGGMGDVTHLVTGLPASVCTVLYALLITGLLYLLPYSGMEKIFKWLCLVLFAYVVAGAMAKPDWGAVLHNTMLPRFQWSREYLSTIVALIGATISPYFLFWQTSQEVEAEYCIGRRTVTERKGATGAELEKSMVDVFAGSFISKLITYFITITAAATLFAQNKHTVESAKDAASALQPVAGAAAVWLFAIGVVGTGLLAVPVLAGSSAYAWSEALRWKASLEEPPKFAPKFYAVLLVSMLVGLGFLYLGFPVVKMLFWASVLNGVLAPICVLLTVLLTSREDVMGKRTTSGGLRWMGWVAVVLSAAASLGMLISFL